MANSEKIDDIIDEKAFKQLERLLHDLNIAQSEFVKTAQAAEGLNTNLGKIQNMKDLNNSMKDLENSSKKMQEAGDRTVATTGKIVKAENDLVQSTKARLLGVQEETKLLEGVSGTLEQNIRLQIKLKSELAQVRSEQKEYNNQMRTSDKVTTSMGQAAQELATKEIELKTAIQQSNLDIKRAVKETNSAESSYDQLSSKLDRLRAAYKSLSEEERNNIEVGGAILASIKEYDTELKNIDRSMGVTTREVGSYSKAISESIDKTGLFSREMAYLTKLKAGYQAAAKGATVATKSFSAALIATGIGAIILLLGSFIAFLAKTQKGMDLLARATDAVGTFLTVFLDALAKLGGQLSDSFIPLIQASVKNLTAMYNILAGIISLDFDRIKKGADDFTQSFRDAGDAVSNIDSISLVDLSKSAAQAAADAARLRGELQDLDKAEARLNVTLAQREGELQKLRELSQDETKSLVERQEASRKVIEIQNELESENLRIKQERLRITQEQNALTTSTEADLQKERDLQIDIARIESETARRRRRYQREVQTLRKEAAAEAKRLSDEEHDRQKNILLASITLEESRLKRSITRTKSVAENEKLSYDDRLSNLEQFLETQEKAILLEQEKQLLNKNLLDSDIIRIEEETQDAIANLKREGSELSTKILKDQLTKEENEYIKLSERKIQEIEKARDNELIALNEQYASGELSEKDYTAKRLKIQQEFNRKYIEEEIKAVEVIIDINKTRGVDTIDHEKQLAALRLQLSQEATDKMIADAEKLSEKHKQEIEKRIELEKQFKNLREKLSEEITDLGVAAINARFEHEKNLLQEKADLIDINKQKEIERVDETIASEEEKANRIAIIEAKAQAEREAIDRKMREAQEKQARFEKAVNIARIIQSTAVAIIKQLAVTPLPVGAPLVATIGAIGAAQIAQVVATPIPKYFKGVESSDEGFAWVGEQGAEARVEPDGSYSLTPDKPTLTWLKEGTKIIPAHETKKMLFDNSVSKSESATIINDYSRLIASYEKGTKELKKVFSSNRSHNTNITKNGMQFIFNKGASRREYLNRNLG